MLTTIRQIMVDSEYVSFKSVTILEEELQRAAACGILY